MTCNKHEKYIIKLTFQGPLRNTNGSLYKTPNHVFTIFEEFLSSHQTFQKILRKEVGFLAILILLKINS